MLTSLLPLQSLGAGLGMWFAGSGDLTTCFAICGNVYMAPMPCQERFSQVSRQRTQQLLERERFSVSEVLRQRDRFVMISEARTPSTVQRGHRHLSLLVRSKQHRIQDTAYKIQHSLQLTVPNITPLPSHQDLLCQHVMMTLPAVCLSKHKLWGVYQHQCPD